MSKVFMANQNGGPEVLELREVPTPVPALGEIRINVKALALNRADILYTQGYYIDQPQFPTKLGFEAAGIVDAVGPGVRDFNVGDQVSTFPGFSLNEYGMFGDSVVVPSKYAYAYPKNLTFEQAASVNVAYMTGYFALYEQGRLRPGDYILITAASSSTGVAAIELAKATGAIVIATSRTQAKAKQLLDLGADHVIATQEEDVVSRVLQITQGHGVQIVYDCVGGNQIDQFAKTMAIGGDYFLYGFLDPIPVPFPFLTAFARSFQFHNYMIYQYTGHPTLGLPERPEAIARAKRFQTNGFISGRLTPHIDKVFAGLATLPQGQQYMLAGQQTGKIVVTV